MGWGRKLPGEEPNTDKPETRIRGFLGAQKSPWTSVYGARSHQISWPEWNPAHVCCLLGSWDKHTLYKELNESSSILVKSKTGFPPLLPMAVSCSPVDQESVSVPCVLHQSFCNLENPQYHFTEFSDIKPVSLGYFQDLEQSPPQCTVLVPPYKPESISELRRWTAKVAKYPARPLI